MKLPPTALALLAAAALACAAPAHAQRFVSPTQRILLDAPSPAALRARLVAHADSVASRAPQDAGAAWHWTGVSFYRASRPDSALAAFRRAWALRANPDDALGMAEAWSATGRGADAESALDFIAGLPPTGTDDPDEKLRMWRGYAAARRAGPQGDPALSRLARGVLGQWWTRPTQPWTRRLAPLLIAAHDDYAWTLLSSDVVQSRGQDTMLVRLANAAGFARAGRAAYDAWLVAQIAHEDSLRNGPLLAAGMRPISVRAADGATLRAWWAPARDPSAPLAVLLTAPWTTPAIADSLIAQLRRGQLSVALLEPRGTGGSSVPGCALPSDWAGREDALTLTVAGDITATITACTRAAGRAPAHVVVGAERGLVRAAALAARDDRRVGAVLLAGVAPSPAEQGTLVATLAESGVPLFFQTSVEDFEGNQLADRIVARLPATQSRVAESDAPGSGYPAFRAGPATGARFTQWLREAWSRPRATRPAPPR